MSFFTRIRRAEAGTSARKQNGSGDPRRTPPRRSTPRARLGRQPIAAGPDRAPRTTTFVYDATGRVAVLTDIKGRPLTFAYDTGQRWLAQVGKPAYDHDQTGDLAAATSAAKPRSRRKANGAVEPKGRLARA